MPVRGVGPEEMFVEDVAKKGLEGKGASWCTVLWR